MLRWLRGSPPPTRDRSYAWVAPWLVVGPVLEPSGYASLAGEGVTHVLDLRSEASDDPAVMRELELEWRRVPVVDRAAPTNQQLAEINGWLDASETQPVVYVHCEGGLGRSPTIATALLMQRGFTRAEAHRFIMAARSAASPTPDQDAWLTSVETHLRSTGEAGG